MARGPASRKFLLTINNPIEHGLDHMEIKKIISENFKTITYGCMCDEVGLETATLHTHLFIAFPNAVEFDRVKKYFPSAHIDFARGTCEENRNYIRKEGNYAKDKKKETNLSETFEEFGEMPIERQGYRSDLADLIDMIKNGMTNNEIISQCPQYSFNIDKIERVRQTIREDKFSKVFRRLETVYIFGKPGTGKTRGVMEKFGYENVYRITDLDHPFDGYKGQDVVIFEEFSSGFRIQDMLNYLYGYPLELPCRYLNKVACFTKVFIISNLRLEDQYVNIQEEHNDTWKAFLRRIHKVQHYTENDILIYDSVSEYFNRSVNKEYVTVPF